MEIIENKEIEQQMRFEKEISRQKEIYQKREDKLKQMIHKKEDELRQYERMTFMAFMIAFIVTLILLKVY